MAGKKKKKGWRERLRRRTSGSGVEPAVLGGGSQLRGPGTVAPARRVRRSEALRSACKDRTRSRAAMAMARWCGRTARRRDGESERSDIARALSRTSCGAASIGSARATSAAQSDNSIARHRRVLARAFARLARATRGIAASGAAAATAGSGNGTMRRSCDAVNGAVARYQPVGCAISMKSRRRDGGT
ncbi:hypothetical protein Scep_007334 [Stephania cephalantha]|uniref:Uncharacterized protein n=1 Tax=Stephania cephalantha TaxID=152367 RepID=A0AAP0KCB4_9MAGN